MTSSYQKNTNTQMNDWGLCICNLNRTTTLAQNVAQSITVPNTGNPMGASTSRTNHFYYAVFHIPSRAVVSVSNTGTAVVPTGSVTATESEVITDGMGRHVTGGTTLSLITGDAAGAVVSVAFFPIE